ncbi:unnamed protein product [Closterium sp. NIES-53]
MIIKKTKTKTKNPVRLAALRAATTHAATAALCPAKQRCPGQVVPPSPSRPPATTTAAAAARDTAAAGGGAAGSAGGAAAQPHQAALMLLLLLLLLLVLLPLLVEVRLGVLEQRSLPLPDDPTPQQLRDWVIQRGSPGGGGFGFMWPQRPRDCASQRCVPGRVEAAALGSSESAVAPGAGESAAALGARESTTTVRPLAAPVPVSLADPTRGPVVARASTVLPCPAIPSGSLLGLHLPAFLTKLLSNAVLQDEWLAASCSCRVLSHQTLLWRHRLGHPSLPRLCSMHSRLFVSGLPRFLPSLPRSPASPCLPCVEGRKRAIPHSSKFPPTTAHLQTLQMDVWGPTPVDGMDQEHYFQLVVVDYTRYTTVFPLRRKADVSGVLIPWIRATRRQLHERFCRDFPVLHLHSERGGEFSSDLLADFCRDEGIRQTFTLPASPQ